MWGLLAEPGAALQPALLLIAMFALDSVLGEPSRWHPLAGFGRLAGKLEQSFNLRQASWRQSMLVGSVLWLICVALPTVSLLWLVMLLPDSLQLVASVLLGYFCIAARSLGEHALAVAKALPVSGDISDLKAARQACARLVSRDTYASNSEELATATVESVLENSNDAVIAPMFWFVVAGLPGMLLFRLSNTLDAMWGYRNQRFNFFGRCAARMDDVLAYLPARLTVLLFTLNRFAALPAALRDGRRWYSPNAGPVMAAGAGALGIRLGGPARYHGELKQRPFLGQGSMASRRDIFSALKLVYRSYLMLLLVLLGFGVLL